jgi:hypothetical protein
LRARRRRRHFQARLLPELEGLGAEHNAVPQLALLAARHTPTIRQNDGRAMDPVELDQVVHSYCVHTEEAMLALIRHHLLKPHGSLQQTNGLGYYCRP